MNESGQQKVTWVPADKLMSVARSRFLPTDVLLDIGCGIVPQNYVVPAAHICVEPFSDYVEVLREKLRGVTDRSFVILNSSWKDALKVFPPQSVDTVVILDVIEHIEKDEARQLLAATTTIARRQVLVFTPLGFLPQCHPDGKDAWGLNGGEWQEHKSGWMPSDFDDRWEFIATQAYYHQDNLGRPFAEPYGAFWAILNLPHPAEEARIQRRSFVISFALVAESLHYSAPVRICLAVLHAFDRLRVRMFSARRAIGLGLRKMAASAGPR